MATAVDAAKTAGTNAAALAASIETDGAHALDQAWLNDLLDERDYGYQDAEQLGIRFEELTKLINAAADTFLVIPN